MFKRILLGGWALLFAGTLLLALFPAASWFPFLLPFSLVLVLSTLGYVLAFAGSSILKRVRRNKQSLVTEEPVHETYSQIKRRRKLMLILSMTLLGALFVILLLVFIERGVRSSTVCRMSIAKARASSEVTEILGKPIQEGWFISGHLTQSYDGSGYARLLIPLSGPKEKGVLKVDAQRMGGNWRLSELQFVTSGYSSTVDLLSRPMSRLEWRPAAAANEA
jgi:hypothetical protein